MPRVNFVHMSAGINKTSAFPTPKRVGELRYWLKAAQAAIADIPRQISESEITSSRMMGSDGWFVAYCDADMKWIRYNLENRWGDKAQIVIERAYNNMGGN